MGVVGFSTGCLFRHYTANECIHIYAQNAVESIEVGLLSLEELQDFSTTHLAQHLTPFVKVTMHAPAIRTVYRHDTVSHQMLQRIAHIVEQGAIERVVFHPDTLEDIAIFEAYPSLPIAIENMDSSKASGIYPEEFERYKRLNHVQFVLDVQHAYEHDPSMQLARELFQCMHARLSHLHLSGQHATSRHALLSQADNVDVILDFYHSTVSHVPAIIEGGLTERHVHEIAQEYGTFHVAEEETLCK